MGITGDPVLAFHFNRAINYFGSAYELDIHDATKDAKSQSQAERMAKVVQARWLADEDDEDDTPQESIQAPKAFRDPAEIFAERKKLRADGQL